MKKILIAVILGALSAGCVVYPARHADVVVGVAPYPGAIWVPGYWGWYGYHRSYYRGYWRHR